MMLLISVNHVTIRKNIHYYMEFTKVEVKMILIMVVP